MSIKRKAEIFKYVHNMSKYVCNMSKYMDNIAKFKVVHILTYIEDRIWTLQGLSENLEIIRNDNLRV